METVFEEPTVIIALFVLISAVVSVVSPLILSKMQASQRHDEKEEDWKRQDQVAEKAAEAAALLKEFNENAITASKKTDESNGLIHSQLTVIHALVNSSLTAQIQATLDSTKRELILMQEVVDMKEGSGKQVLGVARRAMELTELKISELEGQLKARLAQVNSVSNSQPIPEPTKEQIKSEKDSMQKLTDK